MSANKPRPPVTAKPWAIHAACATPSGIALIDLLSDYPTHWENHYVRERIRTLCDTCPVKGECRRLGQENAREITDQYMRLNYGIPYAGHPLKHYRDNLAA